ncbi:MAG: hypothetical protein K2W96_25745 [Gemmataceae bacterium]|nr:hypothetical protein [Gemmataceae bacterium]
MSVIAKVLTAFLGILAVALALAGPARADVILEDECYAETTSREEAYRIARNINAGRVRGWRSAKVRYDAPIRIYAVYATRTAKGRHPVPAALPPEELDVAVEARPRWIGRAG